MTITHLNISHVINLICITFYDETRDPIKYKTNTRSKRLKSNIKFPPVPEDQTVCQPGSVSDLRVRNAQNTLNPYTTGDTRECGSSEAIQDSNFQNLILAVLDITGMQRVPALTRRVVAAHPPGQL